jgi:hypothetical protein
VKYLCLIYDDETSWQHATDAEREDVYGGYKALMDEYGPNGRLVDGSELQPTTTATTVAVRNGETLVTDGPFAETKEQLGGYILIDVDSLDEALEFAGRIPTARTGRVEIRPLVEGSA